MFRRQLSKMIEKFIGNSSPSAVLQKEEATCEKICTDFSLKWMIPPSTSVLQDSFLVLLFPMCRYTVFFCSMLSLQQ